MSGTLVLVRHGQSDWNLKNLFTGWKDPELTELGVQEANAGGKALAEYGITFDIAFTSDLKRAQDTLKIILDNVGQPGLETIRDQALNERDYGDLSGLNKDDARAKWGEEQVHIWRRSYDVPPPGGESLRDTGARVWPYYLTEILPRVLRGEKVLVAAHGNSLRSLVMVLDRLTKEQILGVNLATGVPMVYKLNADSALSRPRKSSAICPARTEIKPDTSRSENPCVTVYRLCNTWRAMCRKLHLHSALKKS
jgi:2,3-bisphosphoglycerate-dependent phosphoglycerate mutase